MTRTPGNAAIVIRLGAAMLGSVAAADVIHVPADVPSIQDAVTLAAAGDVIEIAPGAYAETIDLLGKAVTVRGTGGAGVTIIDGTGHGGPVVRCVSGETPSTVLEGLTVTGGVLSHDDPVGAGGGVHLSGSAPTIIACRIEGNTAQVGGGLYLDDADPVLDDCIVASNSALDGAGVAIVNGSRPLASGCTFQQNVTSDPGDDCFEAHAGPGCSDPVCETLVCDADPFCCDTEWDMVCVESADTHCGTIMSRGGGVFCHDAEPVFRACVFLDNQAHYSIPNVGDSDNGTGGGVAQIGGRLTLVDCEIRANGAGGGGGLRSVSGELVLSGCRIDGNNALFGAGVNVWSSVVRVVNCVLVDNFAAFGAGGGWAGGGRASGVIANCLFLDNHAPFGGGGLYEESLDVVIANCIIRGNAYDQATVYLGRVIYCNVEGGFGGIGNFDADPLFVDAVAGDYRLAAGSPCIDAGHTWALPADTLDLDGDGDVHERWPLDLGGNPRLANGVETDTGCGVPAVVDVGPLEAAGTTRASRTADLNGDGVVDVEDLVQVIVGWGPCLPAPDCCLADLDLDRGVGVDELVEVIVRWGPR